MELTEKARHAYSEMVSLIEKEVAELSLGGLGTPETATPAGGIPGGIPHLYAHMGHSRTPSACSAISFSSSILSEPISENYPHSEPETDSRGYEIVKVATKDALTRDAAKCAQNALIVDKDPLGEQKVETEDSSDVPYSDMEDISMSVTRTSNTVVVDYSRVATTKHLNEIDEGNEADTEDAADVGHRNRRTRSGSRSRSNSNDGSRRSRSRGASNSDGDDEAEAEDAAEEKGDTVPRLPRSSLHSSLADLNAADLQSQHSSKTVELSAEALSTHSSHNTLVDTSTTSKMGNTSDMGGAASVTPPGASSRDGGSTTPKLRPIDKEKMIESWVVEAQQQMERLKVRHESK